MIDDDYGSADDCPALICRDLTERKVAAMASRHTFE
jgi:hypothetical protein